MHFQKLHNKYKKGMINKNLELFFHKGNEKEEYEMLLTRKVRSSVRVYPLRNISSRNEVIGGSLWNSYAKGQRRNLKASIPTQFILVLRSGTTTTTFIDFL